MAASSDIAAEFAAALDAEDYALARSLLADRCIYESPTGEITGPEEVVDSYRGNGEKARGLFDSVVYRHAVKPLGDGWIQITFIDELFSATKSHEFRCRQRVCIDTGKIVRIIHEELPGERERLNAFIKSLG